MTSGEDTSPSLSTLEKKEKLKSYYSLVKYDTQKVTEPNEISIIEQKKKMTEILLKQIGGDEVWCLISVPWFEKWKAYVNLDNPTSEQPSGEHPGKIDNSELVKDFEHYAKFAGRQYAKLREGEIEEGIHYTYIHESGWNLLLEWYGGMYNGFAPSIARFAKKVIIGYPKIEVYPYYVKIGIFKPKLEDQKFKIVRLSNSITFNDAALICKDLFQGDLPDNLEEMRLWSSYLGNPNEQVQNMDTEIKYLDSRENEEYLIEIKEEEQWHLDYVSELVEQKDTFSSYYSSRSSSYSSDYYTTNRGDGITSNPGVVGLSNLGNTCFMNSALQCLTKTNPIRNYLIKGGYKEDLNLDNPLGMNGKIAESFANLMKEMWSGQNSVITPREFKHNIGKFAPQFSGYQQHDSAELIAFLLDGIHEDLNRIKKKPVTEIVQGRNRKSEEVAKEAWDVHRLRNDSIVVDKFQGQFRSELQCPSCKNISITFDPFMYLSLPIPGETVRFVDVFVKRLGDIDEPIKYKFKLPKNGEVQDLRNAVAAKCNIKPNNLIIADIWGDKVYRLLNDRYLISQIRSNDVTWAFEIENRIAPKEELKEAINEEDSKQKEEKEGENGNGNGNGKVKYVFNEKFHQNYSRRDSPVPVAECKIFSQDANDSYYSSSTSICKTPLVFSIEFGKTTYKDLYLEVLSQFKRFFDLGTKKKLLELGIDLDKPETCFPLPKSAKTEVESTTETITILPKGPNNLNEDINIGDENTKMDVDTEEIDGQAAAAAANPTIDMKDEVPDATPEESKDTKQENDAKPKKKKFLFKLKGPNGKKHSSKMKLFRFDKDQKIEENQAGEKEIVHLKAIFTTDFMDLKIISEKLLNSFQEDDSVSIKEEKKKEEQLSISKCIEKFVEKEVLTQKNTWYCPKCKKHVCATKKIDIWKLPEVLVIQIKRFQSHGGYHRDKLSTFVDYPFELNMIEHSINKKNTHQKYKLNGVSNHFGSTGGGHYTAYAKVNDVWYEFDDSSTRETRKQDVVSSSGYVLFYESTNSQKEYIKPEPAKLPKKKEEDKMIVDE